MKLWLIVLCGLVGLGFLQSPLLSALGPYYNHILVLAGINIILAVSLNLTNGIAGQFSIGHAGFYAVGAYMSAVVSVYGGPSIRAATAFAPVWAQDTFILLLACLAGVALAAVAGLLVGIPSLRLRGDYLAIVTLGFGEIIRVLILNIDYIGGARGFTGIPNLANFFWIFVGVFAAIFTVRNIERSSFGRALLSIRENEIAAQAMGIPITKYKVMAFVISSGFAGLAGGLFAHFTLYLHTNTFGFNKSFEIIIMVALGGMGSLLGSIMGAVILTVLPEMFRALQDYRMVIYSLVLILIMIFRPQGLLGRTEKSARKKKG